MSTARVSSSPPPSCWTCDSSSPPEIQSGISFQLKSHQRLRASFSFSLSAKTTRQSCWFAFTLLCQQNIAQTAAQPVIQHIQDGCHVPAVFHMLLCFLCAVVQRGPACVCKQRENFMFHMFRLEPRPQPHGLLWSAAGVASHVT